MRSVIPTTLALLASATLILVLANPLPSAPDYYYSQVSAVHLVRRASKKEDTTKASPPAQKTIGVEKGNTNKLVQRFSENNKKQAPVKQEGRVKTEARRIDAKVNAGGAATVKPK
ncbi:hypothetical protein BJ085DRAFT_40323 [Dimargaris cristalligena]|uniref:Uncharacterized protein n=1 Tax=Dimargaris cristalligena TaxID=215637 RepID=A0A4P9ZK25_9FUNG|nr:hypothetical protein BJ085DRAFT_40323 [Dimargaris cristalligena]|eukprot:RKP33378.1 hypothetical protein BJ085DRAFT_40323 [Dimargaris cristalligena]